MCKEYDVLVLGGGPAGAAMATLLAHRGWSCLILEKSSFPRYHIGESLVPHSYGVLKRLGLLDKLKASHFPEKRSVRFVHRSGNSSSPFYFSETVQGDRARTWQVQRSEFDQMCLDLARDSGAEVRMETKVKRVLFDGEQAVGVQIRSDDHATQEVAGRVIIDASGRATLLGSQLDLKADVPGLNKASIWGYFQGGQRLPGLDAGETTVFMLPDNGWFWYIPLPDDLVSVGIVASPDYLFKTTPNYEQSFRRELEECRPLKERLGQARQVGRLRGLPRLAYRNRQIVGHGWVMIGDAAMFLDPIYSSGLFLALCSAEMAADCCHEALVAGDVTARQLGDFVRPLSEGVEVIDRLIRAFYEPGFSFGAFVRRFPEHRTSLINCLVGDVIGKDMTGFKNALAKMMPLLATPTEVEQAKQEVVYWSTESEV